jgi:hypothetical protein
VVTSASATIYNHIVAKADGQWLCSSGSSVGDLYNFNWYLVLYGIKGVTPQFLSQIKTACPEGLVGAQELI